MAGRGGGAGRSADAYSAMNFDSYAQFASGAMDALSRVGGSIDVLKDRMPALADTIFRGIGKQFNALHDNIQKTADAVSEIDKQLDDHFKKLADTRKKEMAGLRGIGQSLYNDMLKQGKATRKIMAGLDAREQEVFREKLQRQQNDMKKAIPKFQLLKHAMFDADPKQLKEAMMAPFQAQMESFRKMKNSVAGRTMMAMIPGQRAMKDGLDRAKRWIKGFFTGDIWTTLLKTVFTVVQKVADTVKKVLTFDVFNFFRQKFAELKALYESIPGYQEASAAYQNIQSALSEIRRQYGGTVQMSRELTNEIYAASNATILVADNTRALLAVQSMGVRNTEESARLMREVAAYSKAWGVSEEEVARLLVSNRTNLRMTVDEAYSAAAAAGIFADRMAQAARPGELVASTAQQVATLSQYTGLIQRRQAAAAGTGYEGTITQTVQRDLMALRQAEASANLAGGELTQMYSAFGTTEGAGLLGNMLGDPTQVERMVREGRMPELMQMLVEHYQSIAGDTQQTELFQQVMDSLGLGTFTAEQMQNQIIPAIAALPRYTDEASRSFLGYSEALDEANRKAGETLTPLQQLTGEIEVLGNSIEIGGIKLGEIDELFTVFDQRLGIFSQGFGLASRASDFIFGPLSPIAQIITGAPLALAAIGGLTGEFNDTFATMGGPLGAFFQFGQKTFNTFWPKVEEVLKKTWEGVQRFFTETGYGADGTKTLFGAMIDSGVNWVVRNGPEIVRQVSIVATEMLNALSTAFQTIENSKLGDALSTMFVSVLESAIPIIAGAVDVFISMANAMLGVLQDVLENTQVGQSIRDFVVGLFGVIEDNLGAAGGVIENIFDTIFNYATPFMTRLAEDMGITLLKTLAEGIAGTFLDPLGILAAVATDAERRINDRRRAEAIANGEGVSDFSETGTLSRLTRGAVNPNHPELGTVLTGEEGGVFSSVAYQGLAKDANRLSPGGVGLDNPLAGAHTVEIISIPGVRTVGGQTGVHRGYDSIVYGPGGDRQTRGWPVIGFDSGRLFNAGVDEGGWGNYVAVEHPIPTSLKTDPRYEEALRGIDSHIVIYSHLESFGPGIQEGALNRLEIPEGTVLGFAGMTGRAEGYHLHTESRVGNYANILSRGLPDSAFIIDLKDAYPEAFPSEGSYSDETGGIRAAAGIQGFATGGIVSQPTIAVIGEGGQSEAVVPLDDWNRNEDRRHGESVSELREISRRIEELIRVVEDGGMVSAALGA